MKQRFLVLALILVVGGVLVTSCQKEEPLSDKKEVLSFIFEASKNAELDHNVLGAISGTGITADLPFGVNPANLIPSIEVSANAVISPVPGVITDFSTPVSYTVTAEDGSTKEFTASVIVAPAPYIGSWESNAIDFGRGLMHIRAEIDENGHLVLELKDIMTGELDSESVKGRFDPKTKPGVEAELVQTHKWASNQWTEMENQRTIMYQMKDNNNILRLYYCYCYPKVAWAFEADLYSE
jgi:hypothetical protein